MKKYILLFLWFTVAFMAKAQYMYVTRDCALRNGPNESFSVMANLSKGEKVKVEKKEMTGWTLVTSGNKLGYIKSVLLSATKQIESEGRTSVAQSQISKKAYTASAGTGQRIFENPYFAGCDDGSYRIDKIILTQEKTKVIGRFFQDNESGFVWISANTVIVDVGTGRVYHLLSAKGLTIARKEVKKNTELPFTLEFEPLPVSTHTIDLIEDTSIPAFNVYRIDLTGRKAHASASSHTKTYNVVEQMPSFPGGEAALLQYVNTHIKYPASAQKQEISGVVVLRFVVREDGTVGEVIVEKSLEKNCDEEAVRVVKSLPRFIPGKIDGSPVRVWYTLPIRYVIT